MFFRLIYVLLNTTSNKLDSVPEWLMGMTRCEPLPSPPFSPQHETLYSFFTEIIWLRPQRFESFRCRVFFLPLLIFNVDVILFSMTSLGVCRLAFHSLNQFQVTLCVPYLASLGHRTIAPVKPEKISPFSYQYNLSKGSRMRRLNKIIGIAIEIKIKRPAEWYKNRMPDKLRALH